MSQYDWLAIDPDEEDGTELAVRLNAWMAAVESNHRGSTEPTYASAGMIWANSVSGTVEQLFYYDGTQSVLLATVNPTAHTMQFPASALPAATTSAAGASELLTTTELLTGTDTTRVATADSVAAIWEDGGNVNASGVISLGEGGSFNLITSTANITGFAFATAKTGRRATVHFNTIRTLVASSSLILPTGANIVTAVDDLAEVEDRGGGVARVKYYRASGAPLASAVTIPTGTVLDYAGTVPPTGFLLCDGNTASRTTYAALFAVIGTTFGVGDGSTTFNLPDLRGRVTAGKDDMGGTSANRLTNQSGGLNGDLLGAAGGAEQHTLVAAELPPHIHNTGTGTVGSGPIVTTGAAHVLSGSVPTDGGNGLISTPHNNVQPTMIMNKIIKT